MEQINNYMVLLLLVLVTTINMAAGGKGDRRRRLTAEEQLIMDLFRGYDTDARAVVNTSATVTVSIQFLLLRIQRLDEISQILMTTGLLIAEWTDERLSWDPKLYNNVTDVVVRAARIWTPELAIINGADDMIQEFEKIRVLISSNGLVHWEPGGVFVTTCDIDIIYFPFDSQSCPIEIGAWAYKSSRMNLTNVDTKVETAEFKLNGEWRITSTRAQWQEVVLPCCADIRYSKVIFVLDMDRRYIFYVMNIIVPCVLLSVLILMVFCVPPDAGEKISAGISVLLAFTVFLLMLADNVPRTSLDVPILVAYLGSTMALGTLSVCLTVGVLNIHHRGSNTRVPDWVRRVFLYRCARVFGFYYVERKTYSSADYKAPSKTKKTRLNNMQMQEFEPVNSDPHCEECYDPHGGVGGGTGRGRYISPQQQYSREQYSPKQYSQQQYSPQQYSHSQFVEKHMLPPDTNTALHSTLAAAGNTTCTASQSTVSSAAAAAENTYLMRETILNEALQYHNIPPGACATLTYPPGSSCSGAPGRYSRRSSIKSQQRLSRTSSPNNPTHPTLNQPNNTGATYATTSPSSSSPSKVSKEEAYEQEMKEEIIREWHLLARVLDRILFCIVFLTMLCCALFILLSPWYAGKRKTGP